MKQYSEITMTFKERAKFIKQYGHNFSPKRLLEVTKQLNEDRAQAALFDCDHPSTRTPAHLTPEALEQFRA